jgi:hypothetical protein
LIIHKDELRVAFDYLIQLVGQVLRMFDLAVINAIKDLLRITESNELLDERT